MDEIGEDRSFAHDTHLHDCSGDLPSLNLGTSIMNVNLVGSAVRQCEPKPCGANWPKCRMENINIAKARNT